MVGVRGRRLDADPTVGVAPMLLGDDLVHARRDDVDLVGLVHDDVVVVLLASQLSRTNGHVCQVSVLPDVQSRGLGTVLVSSALDAFRREGLETASLSVTVDNRRAYDLYRRLGFELRKEFAAHAWVRPPARLELPD